MLHRGKDTPNVEMRRENSPAQDVLTSNFEFETLLLKTYQPKRCGTQIPLSILLSKA